MRTDTGYQIPDSRLRKNKEALAFVLALAVTVAVADVPLAAYWGERVAAGSARDLAFGGLARIEAVPSAWFSTPAMLGFMARPAVEASAGLALAQEQRTRIIYDQFENAVGEVVVADNAHSNLRLGPVSVGVPLAGMLGVAAGVRPVVSYDYDYYKEYRDDFYAIIGQDIVHQAGTLYAAGLGLGVSAGRVFGMGASAAYLFGTRSLDITTIRLPDTTREYESGKPSGIGYNAGLSAEVWSRFRLNAGFSGGTKLRGWRSEDPAHDSLDRGQPNAVKLGVEYQAPGALPSRVMAELGYEMWNGVDTSLTNLLVVRAGVEHLMLNFVRIRYGFAVEPQPFDPTVQTAQVGAAVGFDTELLKVDVGARFRRSVFGSGLFRTPLSPSDQTVYETGAELGLTLSREF